MHITNVQIGLVEDKSGHDQKFRAYAHITFDRSFKICDLRVIEDDQGIFVAMPSRKVKKHCHNCNLGNRVKADYCNRCGSYLAPDEETDNQKENADVAHPITRGFRNILEKHVIDAYKRELTLSQREGYVSRFPKRQI